MQTLCNVTLLFFFKKHQTYVRACFVGVPTLLVILKILKCLSNNYCTLLEMTSFPFSSSKTEGPQLILDLAGPLVTLQYLESQLLCSLASVQFVTSKPLWDSLTEQTM